MFAIEDDDQRIAIRVAKVSILISGYVKRAVHIVEIACRARWLKIPR